MSTKKKVHLLLCLAHVLSGIAAGLLTPESREQGLIAYALGISIIIGIYVWCRTDLTFRVSLSSSRWALWSALLPLPVVPIYLFRTRPPAKAFKSLVQGVGIYVGLTLVFILSAVAGGIAGAA